ncbi:MAG: polyprenyl synthetase family protein [Anaerolineae bacterium]
MQRVIGPAQGVYAGHYGMLRYHMGWVDPAMQPAVINSGKRIRPVVCLLACAAVGGAVEDALPAAAAVELLHNFSLIHDDVEDNSSTRRHRPTVWALWGVPQAINAGDAMFTLARLALHGVTGRGVVAATALEASAIFDRACLRLTEGQYLDMSFEDRQDVAVEEYVAMIEGKTAALLSASLELGALLGGADEGTRRSLAEFGRGLGLAFQMQDDILGIWGDETITGKSAASDILARKKSLPVVYALARRRGRGGAASGLQPAPRAGRRAGRVGTAGAGRQPGLHRSRLRRRPIRAPWPRCKPAKCWSRATPLARRWGRWGRCCWGDEANAGWAGSGVYQSRRMQARVFTLLHIEEQVHLQLDPRAAPARPLRLPAALSQEERRGLPGGRRPLGQGRLSGNHAHQHRRPHPLSTGSGERRLQTDLQAAHGRRAGQQPGAGTGH